MLNNMWWTSHVKKKNCPTDLQFQFQYIRIRCRSWCLWQKKKASLKSERIFLHRYLGGERGYTWWKNNFSKVKWSFWGCKVITATGNRMPLLKTASHNTVSESVASLTFFSPLSSFTHYQVYFFLNPQILHSLCRGSVSYKLLLSFFSSLRMLNLLSIEKLFIFQNWTVTPMQMQDWRNLELPLKLQQMTMSSKHAGCKYILKDFVPALIKASSTASTFFFFSRFPFYLS